MGAPGRFVTLEGGEGTGKSTLIEGLHAALLARGITCHITREPGGTVLAEALRALALTPPEGEIWSPLAQALLMNAARDHHLQDLIRPALARGDWILCDRFSDSTRAYQSIDGVAPEILIQLEQAVVGSTRPDLTLILDADPDALMARRRRRGTRDVYEDKTLAFHQQVRDAFLQIAAEAPERCLVLDALPPAETVLQAALKAIEERLGGL
ncbi:MAG: dTMP kinase [Pseudomonadota bacterium]